MRLSVVLLLLVGVLPVHAQETPRTVIERAIAAHGGYEKLSRARADRARLRGNVHAGSSVVPFTSEVTVQLPQRYRSAVTMGEGVAAHTIVHEMDGSQVTITVDGKPQSAQGAQVNQLRQTLELEAALRLVPLLDEKAYALSHLGEFGLLGRVVVGVGVRGQGQRDLKLYFDRETALLVKTEQLIDGLGKDIRQEVYYRDHREVAGHVRPGRAAAYRDGKKVMETELIDVVRLEATPR